MSSEPALDPSPQIEQLELKLKRKIREAEILDEVTAEIQSSSELAHNLDSFLVVLHKHLSFRHSMILRKNSQTKDLVVTASHGYSETGIGARVKIGEGIIGTVAKRKKSLTMPSINLQVAYMMAAKDKSEDPEEEIVIKLPGLQNPKSQIAIPLLIQDELMGVLTLESEQLNLFKKEDEYLISQVANHAAIAIGKGRLLENHQQSLLEIEKLEKKVERKRLETRIFEEMSSKIRSSLDLNFTLDTLLELLDKNFGFAHSMVLLSKPNDSYLRVFASYGYPESGIGATVKIGEGVIGTVAKRKKIMRLGSINMQLRYMRASQQVVQERMDALAIELPGLQNPRSQVAIPLLIQDELVGVLSVEGDEINIFKEEDETLISLLANQAAIAIQNARHFETEKTRSEEIQLMNKKLADLNQEQQRTLNLFVKYVPEPVVQKALSDKPGEMFDGELLNIAVLFCDIRNFTPLSENIAAKEVVFLLNTYYTQMDEVIKRYDGVVNQFVGDEIFVTFGAPVSIKKPREKSVLCALDMIKQLENINQELEKSLDVGIQVGIGINFGPVVAGNLGSKDRIEYSVTGDTVNTAKRIESLTKTCPDSILISQRVFKKTQELVHTKAWERIKVKGRDQKVRVYEVVGLKP